MKPNAKIIQNLLDVIIKKKYPELNFSCEYGEMNLYGEKWATYSIWVYAPNEFFEEHERYGDSTFEEIQAEIRTIFKMFGIFSGININWSLKK